MQKLNEIKSEAHKPVDDVTKKTAWLINRMFQHEEMERAWFFNAAVLEKLTERMKLDLLHNITEVVAEARQNIPRR